MRILMINVVCGIRSTGRICTDIASALEAQGHEVKIAYGREEVPASFQHMAVRIGNDLDIKLHGLQARVFDEMGYGSKKATEKFILWAKEFDPDIIHLHNLHGYYIHFPTLFHYLKSCGKKIIWTLHDCWAFTGHCAYFDYAHCNKWITGCYDCPEKREYPTRLLIDHSKHNYADKKYWFTDIPNMTLITPSKWLSDLVSQSFLQNYPCKVIHNGINTDIFKYTENDIKEKYGIIERKIILGVAAIWDRRKGLNDFIELASLLDAKYQVILIGLTETQLKTLPANIIGLKKTNNVRELVEFYSAADVFVNPTYEDNYPTTNLEALSCGTPVISYNTGGSVESAKLNGIVVPKGDMNSLINAIMSVCRTTGKTEFNADLSITNTVQRYLNYYKKDA